MRLKLPIGYDNFGDVIAKGLTFVDKSLLIKEFIDNEGVQVSLITRPRRFGKSLNLSMLHHFFAEQVIGKPTKGLFDHLKIAQQGEAYMQQQGQSPVISLSFKELRKTNFSANYNNLKGLLVNVFEEYLFLLDSPKVSSVRKKRFETLIQGNADEVTIESSLFDLTHCLYQHYDQKVVLLIDEYDTPIQSSYLHGHYEQTTQLMRNLLGAALKNSPYLHRALLTGILRVSKESLFSGLNNIKVYSMLNKQYGDYFGFTQEEVNDLFTQSGLAVELPEIQRWYNGYQIGNSTVYNPWSIVNCLTEQGLLKPYWVNTSGNDLLKTTLAQTDASFKRSLESLLENQSVERLIDESFVFADLSKEESAIWSLLLASGYLKAITAVPDDELMRCELSFPNYEVNLLYQSLIKQWFSDKMSYEGYALFLRDLLTGHIEDFTHRLEDFLFTSASHFDVSGDNPEKFYHGFVLGLMVSLQDTHSIRSNRESGYGRYDVLIIPNDKSQLGIVLEFKTAKKNEELTTVAQQALQQVNAKRYAAELTQLGINSILKLGLAFKGKEVSVVSERKNCTSS